jgi:hypothetical protein
MVFENGVKNIQAAAYNGVRTVVVQNLFRTLFLLLYPKFRLSNKRGVSLIVLRICPPLRSVCIVNLEINPPILVY